MTVACLAMPKVALRDVMRADMWVATKVVGMAGRTACFAVAQLVVLTEQW